MSATTGDPATSSVSSSTGAGDAIERVAINPTPAGAINGAKAVGPDFDLVGDGVSRRALCKNPIRCGKDLERSNCIEQLNARISENTDLTRLGLAYGQVVCSISFHDCAIMPDGGAPCQSHRICRKTWDQWPV
jgi:hypothetical protein